jgi:hypothetical protein
MKIFGNTSTISAESKQVMRLLRNLKEIENRIEDEFIILINFKYEHQKGDVIEDDKDFDGEIDMAVFARHMVVIYELKAKKVLIRSGTTDNRFWEYQYLDETRRIKRFPFFAQASKQRAYLLREYLNDWKLRFQIPQPNHFSIDSRIVFLPGSDFSRFFYKAPAEYSAEAFETDFLALVDDREDRDFLNHAYSGINEFSGRKKRIKLSSTEYTKLYKIIREYGIVLKTENWFNVITEDQIMNDFVSIKMKPELLDVSFEHRLLIPEDLGLSHNTRLHKLRENTVK